MLIHTKLAGYLNCLVVFGSNRTGNVILNLQFTGFYFTIPANPKKAMAKRPAVINAAGVPSILFGSFTM